MLLTSLSRNFRSAYIKYMQKEASNTDREAIAIIALQLPIKVLIDLAIKDNFKIRD